MGSGSHKNLAFAVTIAENAKDALVCCSRIKRAETDSADKI
jgi:hypothetical protein